jgi:hypothetical protein
MHSRGQIIRAPARLIFHRFTQLRLMQLPEVLTAFRDTWRDSLSLPNQRLASPSCLFRLVGGVALLLPAAGDYYERVDLYVWGSIMRSELLGLVILLSLPASGAAASPRQDSSSGQQSSLGDAARRAQEQKKNQQKGGRVWDNDNLPAPNDNSGINVVGPAPASENATAEGQKPATPPATEKKAAPAASSEEKDALEADLKAAKAQLDTTKTDLDIARRKYALDYQSLMGKPGSASDKEAAAALESEKSDVDAKQQEANDAQKKVDDLQAKLDALNNSASK